jgi:hypothetical protein
MLIYILFAILFPFFLAYTRMWQEATLYWHNQITRLIKLKDLQYPASPWTSANLSVQDHLTPKRQNYRNIVSFGGLAAFLIVGFVYFAWYIPLITIAGILFTHSLCFLVCFPKSNSDFLFNAIRRRIVTLRDMSDRLSHFEHVEIFVYLIELLDEAKQNEILPEDIEGGFRAIRTLAEEGAADFQATLGGMYLTGNGVSQNYTEAFIWLTLADADINVNVPKEVIETLKEKLSPKQLAEAQTRGSELFQQIEALKAGLSAEELSEAQGRQADRIKAAEETATLY